MIEEWGRKNNKIKHMTVQFMRTRIFHNETGAVRSVLTPPFPNLLWNTSSIPEGWGRGGWWRHLFVNGLLLAEPVEWVKCWVQGSEAGGVGQEEQGRVRAAEQLTPPLFSHQSCAEPWRSTSSSFCSWTKFSQAFKPKNVSWRLISKSL